MHVMHLPSKLPLLVYDLREPVLNQSMATRTNKQTKTNLLLIKHARALHLQISPKRN